MFGNVNIPGLGSGPEATANLIKAMTEGSGIATPNAAVPGDASPLNIQDLQQTLANATYAADDAALFKVLQTKTYLAKSPTVQYDLVTSYGNAPGIWGREIGLGVEQDSTYVRKTMESAIMNVSCRISFRAASAQNIGNLQLRTIENNNKAALMAAHIDRALYTGNRSIIPEQFDGIERLIQIDAPLNLVDRRAGALNLSFVNQMCKRVFSPPNYGKVTHVFMSPGIFSDILNEPTAVGTGIIRQQNGESNVALGIGIERIITQFGTVNLVADVFIQPGQPATDLGDGPTGRPTAPVSAGAITTPVNAASLFAAGDAGTYIYKIAAINYLGFSPVLTTAGVTVAAGDSANIPVARGDTITNGYVVYRSAKDGLADTCKEAFRIAATGPSQTIIDLNAYLPGTSKAYFLSLDKVSPRDNQPSLQWCQLTPMVSIDLAVLDTTTRWMLYNDAGLIIRIPKQHLVAYNLIESDTATAQATGNNWI